MFSLLMLNVLLGGLLFTMLVGLGVMMYWAASGKMIIIEWSVWGFSSFDMPMVVMIDKFSSTMAFTVMLITISVMLFSSSYMSVSPATVLKPFYLILMLFVGSMFILIFMPGTVSLFLGWDGLGVTSYLLILTYANPNCFTAAILTVVSNRIGDALMLSAIGATILAISTNPAMGVWDTYTHTTLIFMFLLGASTKSAQLPFSAWLPAAMAAPTPVSALVHSSTLVTAGIYVMIRVSSLLPIASIYLMIVGGMTTIMASVSALKEPDIKKIIALSTLSQLGVMVTSLGVGTIALSFFHLIAHAYFKALMFICVGDLIHAQASYQNLMMFSAHGPSHPATCSILVSAKLALCGLPFYSGFFSKEMVLEGFSSLASASFLMYLYFFISVGLTCVYSARFVMKVMSGLLVRPKLLLNIPDWKVWAAMLCLILPSASGGGFMHYLFKSELMFTLTPPSFKMCVILLMFIGAISVYTMNYSPSVNSPVMNFNFNMWFTPESQVSLSMLMSVSEKLNSYLVNGGLVTLLSSLPGALNYIHRQGNMWNITTRLMVMALGGLVAALILIF